uniref:START domain-containing protein n=1 Tax=Rhabditophanes sp. KR3021 TaxID=114890 RepID=A0AC35TGZ0_9BILA
LLLQIALIISTSELDKMKTGIKSWLEWNCYEEDSSINFQFPNATKGLKALPFLNVPLIFKSCHPILRMHSIFRLLPYFIQNIISMGKSMLYATKLRNLLTATQKKQYWNIPTSTGVDVEMYKAMESPSFVCVDKWKGSDFNVRLVFHPQKDPVKETGKKIDLGHVVSKAIYRVQRTNFINLYTIDNIAPEKEGIYVVFIQIRKQTRRAKAIIITLLKLRQFSNDVLTIDSKMKKLELHCSVRQYGSSNYPGLADLSMKKLVHSTSEITLEVDKTSPNI